MGPDPADRLGLAGKVVLVTGSTGTLGRSVCEVFAERGATVAGVDVGPDADVSADLSTEEGNRRAVEETVARHGRLDAVVLNAGVQHMAPLAEFEAREWDRLIAVMLSGPFHLVRAAWPHLTAAGAGRVLATASTSSYVAERYKAGYVAAKHGLLGLIKVVALEGAEHGVTANAVAPSWMRTAMVEQQVARRSQLLGRSEAEVVADLVTEHAVKRFVEPREVADTLAFLACEAASGITGTCVPVDLGALA